MMSSTSRGNRSIRLAIAGGGTGGHVLPVVAVLEEFERRELSIEPLWIGSKSGLERSEAERRGIPYQTIQTGKLRRYLDWQTIPDAARIPAGTLQAVGVMRGFKPDVVFSSGGFVSVPTVVAARMLRSPVLTHEQTASFGLANKINARFSDVMAFSYESSRDLAGGQAKRAIVTGNPIRSSLFDGQRDAAFALFGLDPDLPLVYVTGGARGASPLNTRIEAMLPVLLHQAQIVHQTGPDTTNGDYSRLLERREALPDTLHSRYVVTEYVRDELSDLYAAADLVVARAGAGSVAEFAALGQPSIMIPLPGSGGGEQWLNARVLEQAGGAVVIDQDDATPERLLTEITSLLNDRGRLETMSKAAQSVGRADAASNLADALLDLAYTQSAHELISRIA